MKLLANPHFYSPSPALMWAGNATAGKIAVDHISPMVLTFSRWTIALIVIVAISQKSIRADWPKICKHWRYLLLMGGFGFMGFNFALYLALHHTSTINVTIEQTAMPLLIFLFTSSFSGSVSDGYRLPVIP